MNEYAEKGKAVIEEFMKDPAVQVPEEYIERGRQFVNQLFSVETVSETWRSRQKSNIIKWLMKKSGVDAETMAKYLKCKSKETFNNKLNRDVFSFDELIIAAYACNYTVTLLSNNGTDQRKITAEDFFKENKETWERISGLKNDIRESKRAEYEQKKAELEQMKKEYGFED